MKGLRLSLVYGDCEDFTGLDIGIIGHTDRDFCGLAIGGINCADDRITGGQVGLVNWNGNADTAWNRISIGAQIGVLNYAENFCGLQDGFINISSGKFCGLQSGFINDAYDLAGVQCGEYVLLGINIVPGTLRGCQLGLINYVGRVERGCQIGLLNIVAHDGWCPVLPIINGGF